VPPGYQQTEVRKKSKLEACATGATAAKGRPRQRSHYQQQERIREPRETARSFVEQFRRESVGFNFHIPQGVIRGHESL